MSSDGDNPILCEPPLQWTHDPLEPCQRALPTLANTKFDQTKFGQHHLFVFKVRLRTGSGGRRSGSGPEGPDPPNLGPRTVGGPKYRVPGPSKTPPKFHEKRPKRGKKECKLWRGRGKKERPCGRSGEGRSGGRAVRRRAVLGRAGGCGGPSNPNIGQTLKLAQNIKKHKFWTICPKFGQTWFLAKSWFGHSWPHADPGNNTNRLWRSRRCPRTLCRSQKRALLGSSAMIGSYCRSCKRLIGLRRIRRVLHCGCRFRPRTGSPNPLTFALQLCVLEQWSGGTMGGGSQVELERHACSFS